MAVTLLPSRDVIVRETTGEHVMGFAEWERSLPPEIRDDPLWRFEAYRIATYLSELAYEDAMLLRRVHRNFDGADQIRRAVESIGADISEGYGRPTGKERARYYGFALGSAREARDRYLKARRELGGDKTIVRIRALTVVIRILTTIVKRAYDKPRRKRSE